MGAAAGSVLCVLTVLKTTLAHNNLDVLETGYGISLRTLDQMAEYVYANSDLTLWRPKDEARGGPRWCDSARMHKAVTIMMLKAEGAVNARNPNFRMEGRDFVHQRCGSDDGGRGFAVEVFDGEQYSGKALFDYCNQRAKVGCFAPEGSAARQAGQDFLWYLWCGPLSLIYGRSAMTSFKRIYIENAETHNEIKDPYYQCITALRRRRGF